MPVSALDITKRLAAELAPANTLLVSASGPSFPSPIDDGGPSTWWSDLAGALANERGERPAPAEPDPSAGPRSVTPARFDLLVIDPASLSGVNDAGDLIGGYAATARCLAVLDAAAADTATIDNADVLSIAAAAGFVPDSFTVLERAGVAVLLVPRGTHGADTKTAEHQAMIDRDRLAGVLARSLNIQYDLDHHRIALARSQRQLAATQKKLEETRKQLRRLKSSRKYRVASAVSSPVSKIKGLRGKSSEAAQGAGPKGIGS